MDLREKVARALCEASGGHWRTNDFLSEQGKQMLDLDALNNHWRYKADAAIRTVLDALREPSPGMVMAGISERHEQPVPEAWSLATANIWQAMLDAAIREHAGDADLIDGGE
ncbi:hypothetical protein [Novosphingobium mathurense]|uniref:Uncharacterized protein n=1 Tax=Novosphingobium mathurense TaxID=428990 RepID=A0A1U6I6S6_9SPHN|nr:hypothetical protein [Novosphingobium mathurense]SLK03679.1 hypothetical protein SAMN06295987_104278 [Novosphingobium mathurense]